jgi:hypothetical protein
MNERIKQLALEAFQPINDMASEGIADRHTFNMHWFQLYNQKFAELIVRECMNTIAESREVRQTAYYYRNRVAEHFGVEND